MKHWYVTNPGTGRVLKLTSQSAAVTAARRYANTYGISVPIYAEDHELSPKRKTGKATYRAKKNPTKRDPSWDAGYIFAMDQCLKRYNPKELGTSYKKNPAMYGGSVLSRTSKASLPYGEMYKKADFLVRLARGKGAKRIAARPVKSREHPSRADNFNSVLHTVSFINRVSGRKETVPGLTVKEANTLAAQLDRYGQTNVRVS